MKIELLGFDKDMLISEFGFDRDLLAKNEINLDDFDFNMEIGGYPVEDEEDKLIKQFVVKFEDITVDELQATIELAMRESNVSSLEDLILKKVEKYENNNA